MDIINEKQAATQLLHGYADVLNKANAASISSFYCDDGLFMPDGFRSITKNDLEETASRFFKGKTFDIKYEINNVTIANEFAFIDATALAIITLNESKETSQRTRDCFVLRKDGTDWKIYRYLFNKVQV